MEEQASDVTKLHPESEIEMKEQPKNIVAMEQEEIRTLQMAVTELKEEKASAEAMYHTERTALEEKMMKLCSRIEELDQKLETQTAEMKIQNAKLDKTLEQVWFQRQNNEDKFVSMVTDLQKLLHEEKEVMHQIKEKSGASMLSLQEEVKQFQLKVRENDTQISELHKIVQGIQAEKIAIPRAAGRDDAVVGDHLDNLYVQPENLPVEKTKFSVDDTMSEESEEELGDILDHFITTTSMHGIGQIIGSKWIVLRVLWIILTLGAMGGLIYHLYSIFVSYYKWPKQTQVSLGLNNSVYPAITICNENIIRKDALESMGELNMLRSFVQYINHRPLAENTSLITDFRNGSSSNSEQVMLWLESLGPLFDGLQLTDSEKKSIEAAVNRSVYNSHDSDRDISFLLEQIFQTIYMNIDRFCCSKEFAMIKNSNIEQYDRASRSQAGHHISDMLISCTFNGYTCYPENFTLYQTSSLGNCWTMSSSSMTAETTGPAAGLSLVLFLQNDQFLESLAHGYGARLAVHAQGTKPVPTENGIFLSAASETNVGLSKGFISRVGSPHGRCKDGADFIQNYHFLYSRQACQIMCLMEEIMNSCGCYGNFYEEFALLANETVHVCNTTKERGCFNDVLLKLDEKTKRCACENPCRETYYYRSVSTRQWPTDAYANLLLEKVCHRDTKACQSLSQDTDPRHLLNNFVKINIFFETLNYEEIEEKPLMDGFQFLASIGGALGLWVGLSVLSFCEIIQLVAKILDFLFCPQKCIHVRTPREN